MTVMVRLDGDLEEFLLGREVVVEGPEAQVGGVGDLLDAYSTRITGGQQRPGSRHRRRARARPAPVQAVAAGACVMTRS